MIQDDFVSRRKDSNTAEEGLKRRMRLARYVHRTSLCDFAKPEKLIEQIDGGSYGIWNAE